MEEPYDDKPFPGDDEAPPPEQEWLPMDSLRSLPGTNSREQFVHDHRMYIVDECTRQLNELPPDRLCGESLDKIVLFAYDAGRNLALDQDKPTEDDIDVVIMVEAPQ